MDFTIEKQYIIKLLFNNLQLDVPEEVGLDKNYKFRYENKVLEINDSFFSRIPASDSYLKRENIPDEVIWIDDPQSEKEKIPGLYGENKMIFEEDYIYCGLDIFASSFFMLTRWEELFLPRDRFGRCDESEMFVVKHRLYTRPIVNEYIRLFRYLLFRLGIPIKESTYRFHPFITHDIDYLFRYASVRNLCQNLAGDILHRKSLKIFFQTCKNYLRYRLGIIGAPFDTFDELMDLSEKFGFKDAFYFKPTVKGEYDSTYDIRDKKVKLIIDKIIRRGHEVGIHPSKNTFHNLNQFNREVTRLNKIYPGISGGRQHFLLYDLPITLHAWEDNGLLYDAGLGFAFRGGFRCGICYPYPFFNVLEKKELKLKIRPLIVMEGALLQYDKEKSLDLIEQEILDLIDIVYRYNGEFVFLWHNDHFYRYEYQNHAIIYKRIIEHVGLLTHGSMSR